VLAVNDEAWGGKAHNASARISLPPNLQFIRYAGATNDERLRLFYVAVTRAKSQLYMVNFASNYAGKTMTRLKYLNETPDEHGVVHSPLLPEGKQVVLPAEEDTPAPTTELAAYWQQRHADALGSADMRALIAARLERYQLSPTHINDFIDLVHCGPQSFFLRTILRFPQAPRPEGEFGSAIHETLEWLHNTTRTEQAIPAEGAVLKWFRRRLETKQFTAHDLPLFAERGDAVLRAYMQQRADTITPDVVVEHNFRNEGVFIGKAHMAGKIDKMIINKTAKTITIVDYKTGRGHTRWSRDVRLHKYRKQLYLYRALVEGSHTYAGYTVTDAYLEFVEPDENDHIQVLPLMFDDAEYAQTKRLAEAIWQRITDIDLPSADQYTADLEGVLQFEHDLLA
jgi:DNA helicase II / ATP-dependent DNA helicase PcrA